MINVQLREKGDKNGIMIAEAIRYRRKLLHQLTEEFIELMD